jgi:hypothetical protein
MKIRSFFLFFGVIFPLLGSGSAICMRIRIRIQQLKLMRIHADPDPKPCLRDPLPIADCAWNCPEHLHHETGKQYTCIVRVRTGLETVCSLIVHKFNFKLKMGEYIKRDREIDCQCRN